LIADFNSVIYSQSLKLLPHNIIIILLFIFLLFVSGCLKEYGTVYLESVDVDYQPGDQGSVFMVTPNIRNTQDTETGQLSVRVRTKDESGMILAEKKQNSDTLKAGAVSEAP